MAATTVFKPKASKKLVPTRSKVDKWALYGQQLLSTAQAAGDDIERALSALRLLMGLTTAILLDSSDAQDTPVCVLGHHNLTKRHLGHAVDGGLHVLQVQEICSFDPQERPREQTWDEQGVQIAKLDMRVAPVAKAKTKVLGREELIKVRLGEGKLWLQPPALLAVESEPAPSEGEVYEFCLPALVLNDPLSPNCSPSLKGDLTLSCATTGCMVSVSMASDGAVSGRLDRRGPAKEAAKGKSSTGQYARIGTFSGSWKSEVIVECPGLGLLGTVLQAPQAGTTGAGGGLMGNTVPCIDLAAMQPMHLPLLWSALLDSIIFNDPRKATGKGALDLSRNVSRLLHGYPLGHAVAPAQGGGGGPATGRAATTTTRARTAPSTTSVGADGGDDDDLLLLPDDARAARNRAARARDAVVARNVPPCILEQHAAGRALVYQLHLRIVHTAALP